MAEHILVMRPIGLWFFRPDRPLKPWLAVARLHGLDPDKTVQRNRTRKLLTQGSFTTMSFLLEIRTSCCVMPKRSAISTRLPLNSKTSSLNIAEATSFSLKFAGNRYH